MLRSSKSVYSDSAFFLRNQTRVKPWIISLLTAQRQRGRTEKQVEQVGSEPLRERPVMPVQRDCRRAERADFIEYCPYEISESLGGDAIAIHQGEALSVNISKGGMLLLMDQSPPVRQVFEIQVPASTTGKAPGLVEVCWTRQIPIEELGSRHLVGVKFLFDPDAHSHH